MWFPNKSKMAGGWCVLKLLQLVWTENIWCIFRVEMLFWNLSAELWTGTWVPCIKTLSLFHLKTSHVFNLVLVGVQHFRKESWSGACCVWRQRSCDRLCVVTRSEMESEADGEYVSCGYLPCERNQISQRSQSVTSPSLEEHPAKRTGNNIGLFWTCYPAFRISN